MKFYFSNNAKKLHHIPMLRKKNKKKRFYTRCEASETIDEFLIVCSGRREDK